MLSISENESIGLIRVIGIHQMRRLNYRCVGGEERDDVIQDAFSHLYQPDDEGLSALDKFDIAKMDKGDGYVNKLGIYLSVVIRRFLINRMHKLDNRILFQQRSLDRQILNGEGETYLDSLDSGVDIETMVADRVDGELVDRNSKIYSAFRRLRAMPHESVGKRDRCLPTVSWFDMLRAFFTGKTDAVLGKELKYKTETIKLRRSRLATFIFNFIGRGDLVCSDGGVW